MSFHTENLWLTHRHTRTDGHTDWCRQWQYPKPKLAAGKNETVKYKLVTVNLTEKKKNALIWKKNNSTFKQLDNSNLTGKQATCTTCILYNEFENYTFELLPHPLGVDELIHQNVTATLSCLTWSACLYTSIMRRITSLLLAGPATKG